MRPPARLRIMTFARDYWRQHRQFPTVREICVGVGLNSLSTVHGHLLKLETDGLIIRNRTNYRGWQLAQPIDPGGWRDRKTFTTGDQCGQDRGAIERAG